MKNILTASTIITLILFATGCDLNNASSDQGRVQVAMQATPATSAAKATLNSNTQNGELEITEVRLFVEEMELESVGEDSMDFEADNFIVDLPLDGSPFLITEVEIPAGLYDEFEMEVERPEDDDTNISDPDFSDESGRYSVVVRGLWNGEEFTYRSDEDFELELEMNPPLEVTEEGGFTVMVEVDINEWFTKNGTKLDPNLEENRDDIDESIENSFDVLEDLFDDDDDDDDDGDDD